MSGSKSSDPASSAVAIGDDAPHAPVTTRDLNHTEPSAEKESQQSPVSFAAANNRRLSDGLAEQDARVDASQTVVDDDGASEAETLIFSPVKKREVAREASTKKEQAETGDTIAVKLVKPLKSRIGSLPVPGEDDEDSASPRPSTEISVDKVVSSGDAKERHVQMDDGSDRANGSDLGLSSARSSPSRASSRSRARSERPKLFRNGESPNPRKRKHRASSVGLPNKRQSVEPQRTERNRRGRDSEDPQADEEQSVSPKLRSHRRTMSTQSGIDGAPDGPNRKRRAVTQVPGNNTKARHDWAESDTSSETTSRAGDESKRPTRQLGRSTSTPGRPMQREHKRHVNKYGFTRLAEACETGDLDMVKEWRVKDPDQVELAEFAGNKPLQIAALNGNAEVVEYLIKEGCQIDCANADNDTPLIDAVENGHVEVVNLLLDAGVDPLRQNLKGQQALDVLTDKTDDVEEIREALHAAINRWNSDDARQRREEEEIQRHRGGPSKELYFMARTYENLLKLVTINDRNGVQEFLGARVPVDNAIIAAAARTGDSYLLNMLLAEMTEKKAYQKPEKPLLAVLGTSHFEAVKLLTGLDQFNPEWRNRQGKSWPEIAAEKNGPMWRQEKELLQRLYDEHAGRHERRSSSPVSKRDSNGKRRMLQRSPTEPSDEEDAVPRRKNGRRLMSRKDLRAAGGKGHLDCSDEELESDDNIIVLKAAKEEEDDGTMPPPHTPTTRGAAGRTRSKSVSSQHSDSPRTRRTSLRADGGLPIVEEQAEEAEKKAKEAARAAREAETLRKKEESERAKAAAEAEARKVEEYRKAQEERLAKERRAEEERRIEEERRVERARQEEENRKREEERRAEEARKAEVARLEAEEARRLEEQAREEIRLLEERLREERKREEERVRQEKELEEAKAKNCADVLEALPRLLSRMLDPNSTDFGYATEFEANVILRWFTPLRIVRPNAVDADANEFEWVLNLQAAPLLGKQGLELFYRDGDPLYEDCLAQQWRTLPIKPSEQHIADHILAALPPGYGQTDDSRGASFGSELERTAERVNGFTEMRRKLRWDNATDTDPPAVLRCVRLQDVLTHVHRILEGREIEVQSPPSMGLEPQSPSKILPTTEKPSSAQSSNEPEDDFVSRLKAFWDHNVPPRVFFNNEIPAPLADRSDCVFTTEVVVVHEK